MMCLNRLLHIIKIALMYEEMLNSEQQYQEEQLNSRALKYSNRAVNAYSKSIADM